jgi:general secretion pathway protein D
VRRVCVGVCVFLAFAIPGHAGQAVPAAAVVASAPVSFDFASVPVMQFAQAIYRDQLGRDFVVSAALVDSQKKVSVRVKALSPDRLAGFVDQVLRSQGVASTLKDGVYYLDDLREDRSVVDAPAGVVFGESAAVKSVDAGRPDLTSSDRSMPEHFFVTRVENRPVDFAVITLNAIFGQNVAKAASGSLVVVSVSEKREKAVRDVLAQIDTAPRSVEVVASFVEVARSDDSTRGFALVSSTLSRKLGATFDVMSGTAMLNAGSYQLVLDALAGDSRFKQVSNSRLVGDEGEKLSLLVGDETPTISQSSRDNQGNPVQNIVYRPSGVILDVVPKVAGSGRLSLVVDGQVSAFQPTVNGVAGSPTLVKRQVKTSVSLNDGQVLVIGGLDDAKESAASGGFSFLPSSWRASTARNQKTDLVLILSAKVVAGR